jgi:hypothetical protein
MRSALCSFCQLPAAIFQLSIPLAPRRLDGKNSRIDSPQRHGVRRVSEKREVYFQGREAPEKNSELGAFAPLRGNNLLFVSPRRPRRLGGEKLGFGCSVSGFSFFVRTYDPTPVT